MLNAAMQYFTRGQRRRFDCWKDSVITRFFQCFRVNRDNGPTLDVSFSPATEINLQSSIRGSRRVALGLMCGLCLTATGCLQQAMVLGYLIGGPPTVEPDFDAKTGVTLSQKEKTSLVLCYAPKSVRFNFDAVDRELAKYVSHRLNQNHIKVVDPDSVQAWLDEHPDWDKPEEIGRDFEVDYVILVEISDFGLYEEGNSNLFRGHSELLISVHEIEEEDGSEIYSKELISKFPIHQPVSTSDMSYYDFKRLYMSRISDEVGRHFYEYFAADDISQGAL